jgi:release factor glutamine methyltransferase
MTIGELYRQFLRELKNLLPSGEADQITRMVFEKVTGLQRSEVIKNPEAPIEATLKNTLLQMLNALLNNEPVQYVLGECHFYQLDFEVNKSVLIPRPETEELVERAIDFCKHNKIAKVLDIGTGSGCIPISIKKHSEEALVTAIDISSDALLLAKKNALKHDAAINFLCLDFLDENTWKLLPHFDLIVSNPPYIPASESNLMDDNVVKFEPHLALFVPDEDPLVFYKKIMQLGKSHLNPLGKILVEIHEKMGNEIQQLFSQNGYTAKLIKDIYEKDRMVEISLCQ